MSREPIGVIGVGYVGLVTAACFADLGHTVICRDIDPEKVAMLQRGGVPIHEPGLADLLGATATGCASRSTWTMLFAEARRAFVCVDTPPTASGDADLSRVQAVIDAIPPSADRRGAGDEVDRAGRHRRERARCALDARGPAGGRLRVEPGVPARGHGRARLHGAPTASSSAPRRSGRRARRPPVRRHRHPDRPHRRRLGRDGQAGLERVPRDEDLVHQRDRQRLRGGRRRRRGGRARAWASTAASARASCGRIGYGGSCFPKDVAR